MPLRHACPLMLAAVCGLAPPLASAQAPAVGQSPAVGVAPEAVAPAAPTGEQTVTDCEIIARVNSEVILACELDWQVRLTFEQRFGKGAAEQVAKSPLFAPAREQLMRNLLTAQIEIALLYGDFRSNAPMADVGAIHKSLEPMFEEREAKRLMEVLQLEERGQLDARLRELGTSVGERRQEFYRTMISTSWLQQSIKYDREVTHEQMLARYREDLEDYQLPARVRWEELMVRFDRHGTKRDAWAAIARLGNEAAPAVGNVAPEDQPAEPAFAAIAPGRSDGFTAEDGGLYDWTERGSLTAERVEAALFAQPIGEMSPILEGPLGFHIVRVLERKDAGPQPFREVQAAIREAIREERHNDAVNAKVTALKKSARLWTKFTGDLSYEGLLELAKQPGDGETKRR